MDDELLSVGQVAQRSGFAPSAIRFYESQGLISAERNSGGQRRFRRSVLRRLAVISAARHLGVSLEEVKAALDGLPQNRTPNAADWKQISMLWRAKLDSEIEALEACGTGSIRASAAAACRWSAARSRTPGTGLPPWGRAPPACPGRFARRGAGARSPTRACAACRWAAG